jgi:hypothetical protein
VPASSDPADRVLHRPDCGQCLGQKLVALGGLLARIPVVKSIYYSVKQVSDTLFSSSGQAFRKALLVQYPREGAWTIAFLTGSPAAMRPASAGRLRQRLCTDHAQPDVRLLPDDAAEGRHRTRHERR